MLGGVFFIVLLFIYAVVSDIRWLSIACMRVYGYAWCEVHVRVCCVSQHIHSLPHENSPKFAQPRWF